MAECVEHVGGLGGEAVHPQRDEARWGVTGAGRVVGDGLDAAGVERPLERVPHLDVAAEAHDEQQRAALAANRDPDEVPVDSDEGEDPAGRALT